jgi:CHAT domain-containing protein
VPTLNISILPFATLKLSDDEYLIDLLSYSIAPSLYEIMVNHQMNKNRILWDDEFYYNFENALFIANPKFPNDSIWKFPSLPGTIKEVNYITSKLDSSTYTKLVGRDATVSAIKNNICDYDLIYFATHGISQEDNPLENSFLVLAGDNNQSFLTAREIQNIRYDCTLNADLVVLSACQTGLGKSHKAGLIGLTRAFQIAGANHVLMSLWSINDNETARLMSMFFDNLIKGGELMPHEALRQAILTYKKDINDNPNYWAAFSIFGIAY